MISYDEFIDMLDDADDCEQLKNDLVDAKKNLQIMTDKHTQAMELLGLAVDGIAGMADEISKCKIKTADGDRINELHLGRCTICSYKFCGDDDFNGCKFEWQHADKLEELGGNNRE